MAIIVDKVQKKKDIALSCTKLFIQKGINSVTIAEVAKAAGVGKGTVYEYFKNKEEIVFEIANVLIQKNEEKLFIEIANARSTKEKIKKFSGTFYAQEDFELREIYKHFISISLINPTEQMLNFQTRVNKHFYIRFEEIIQTGIDNNELIEESLALTHGLFVTGKGMFIESNITNSVDNLEEELDLFIDTVFKLIEVKK